MKIIATVACILIISQSLGQDLDYSLAIGSEFKRPRKFKLVEVFGSNSKGYFAYFRNAEGVSRLMNFSRDLTLLNSTEILIIQNGTKCKINNILFCGDRIYAFYHSDNPGQSLGLCVEEIDPITLMPTGRKKNLIGPAELGISFEDWNASVSLSSDKAHVLIRFRNSLKDPEELLLRLFDSKLDPVWSKGVLVPGQVKIKSIGVDDSTNFYLFGENAHEYVMDGLPNYFFAAVSAKSKIEQHFEVDNAHGRYWDSKIGVNRSNLVCVGLGGRQDMYLQTIDLSGKISERVLLSDSLTRAIPIDTLFLNADGRLQIIREEYKLISDNAARFPTDIHHFGAITILNVSPSGSIDKVDIIEKAQSGDYTLRYKLSYFGAILKGRTYFIYNEGKQTFMVGLNPGMKQSKATVLERNKRKLLIVPKKCKQISEKEVILVRQWNRRQQLVRLTLN